MRKTNKKILSLLVAFLLFASFFTNIGSIQAKAADQPDANKVKQQLIESIKKQNAEKKLKVNTSSNVVDKLANTKEDDTKKINGKDPNEVVRVIVQLDGKAASEGDAKGISSASPINNKTVTGAIQKVEDSQSAIINKVQGITGTKVRRTYGYLVNGFSIETKRSNISKISSISGVKSVTESKTYYPDMKFADTLTQAYSTWQDLGYKGEGMVVAIVDTGIDYTHKDLTITDPSKAKITSTTPKGPGKFYSVKVPYGYNFADGTEDVIDKNPNTEMHGMHVAGIVASNGKESGVDTFSTVRGVAPEAQLLAMKVFTNNPGSKSAYDDDIIAAIEDSVLHGADIINMSLGSVAGFQDANDPTQIAVKNATDNGTVVVISAGNSATSTGDSANNVPPLNLFGTPDTATVGSPGVSKDAITVASYENTNITGPAFDFNAGSDSGLMLYSKSEFDPITVLTSKAGYQLVDCGQGNNTIEETGDDFSGKGLDGKIALVQKVSGTFGNKKLAAQKAGAIGVIFYNAEGDDSIPTTAAKPGVTIPCINVSYSSGAKLKDLIAKGLLVNFNDKYTTVVNPNANDLSAFTSWGPTPELDFKPEISAPGGNIWSLANDNKYQSMSGTSMASPHVAGSEALIVEAIKANNPDITGRALVELAKKTTINTAKVQYDKYNNKVPYSPRRQGAGLIQIESAIKNKVTITDDNGNAAVALRQIGQTASFDLTLTNYGKDAYTYDLSDTGVLTEVTNSKTAVPSEKAISGASIKYSVSKVTVPASGTAKVTVTITLPNNFTKQNYVEGFIKFASSNAPELVVPYMGFYGDWSALKTIDDPFGDSTSILGHFGIPATSLGINSASGFIAYALDGYGNMDKKNAAFSQGDSGQNHVVTPNLYMLRNAKTLQVQVLDKDKKVLRTISSENKIVKNTLEDELAKSVLGTIDNQGTWDGTLYNSETGKYDTAPDGQYYIRANTTTDIANSTTQSVDLPVKIDSEAPGIEITSAKVAPTGTYKLQWKVKDNDTGANGIFAIAVNGEVLSDEQMAEVALDKDTFSIDLQLKDNTINSIMIAGTDYASNVGINGIDVKTGAVPEVYLANLQNGDKFNTNKIKIAGEVQTDVKTLTINGSEVTLDTDGLFDEEVTLKEGNNTINIVAKDKNGTEVYNQNYSVSVDTIKPVISITSPTPSSDGYIYTDKHNIAISGKVNDASTIKLTANDVPVKINGDGTFTANVGVDGNTLVQILAEDSYQNVSEKDLTVISSVNSDPFELSFDNLASFAVLTPKDANKDIYTVTGKVNHKVPVFKINDQNVTVKDDLTFSADVKLAQGNNIVKVYAEDNTGTVVFNYSYKILYDSTAPKLVVSNPVARADGNVYTNQDSITLKGLVNDNTFGYSLFVNGNAVLSYDRYPATGEAPDKPFSYAVPLTSDKSIIKVELVDEFGNTTQDIINVVKDKVAPKAATLKVSNTQLTNKDVNVTIATDSSDKDIDKVEYSFDNNVYLPYSDAIKIVSNGKVYAKVTDYAGNSTISSIDISNIDKTSPVITVSGVEDGKTYINTVITPKVTTDKDAAIALELDGKSYDGTTAISSLGNHKLTITATDKTGNATVKDISFVLTAQTTADTTSLVKYIDSLIDQSKPGDKITVDSTNVPTVSSSIFKALKGADVLASFNTSSPLGAVTWTFNGKDITNTETSVDLGLNATAPSADAIKKLDGNSQIFSFKFEGNLPGKAVVSLPVDTSKIDISKPIYLYHYNPDAKSVDKVGDALTAYKKGSLYYVDITITHCSDYFLSLNGEVKVAATNPTKPNTGTGSNTGNTNTGSTNTGTTSSSTTNSGSTTTSTSTPATIPKTGSVIDSNILIVFGILAIAGGAVIIRRKRLS
ncbi:peptidase S8 [Clostridium folliculivorans]|uniref:Peptidase S8 n=1 Tax=Clostridium folliculivorans TaxID=2886038 RepID=A0A9W5Y4Y1_9CLOT|nr:S8 family serine peptidase [Clostridium folliculivorans]GKU26741.1 peptidase S8 [Clostridium folliculivorans]